MDDEDVDLAVARRTTGSGWRGPGHVGMDPAVGAERFADSICDESLAAVAHGQLLPLAPQTRTLSPRHAVGHSRNWGFASIHRDVEVRSMVTSASA